MMRCEAGDIALVPFPFTDLRQEKKRPALVLLRVAPKTLPPLLVVSMITSELNGELIPGDCLLKEWEVAGLLYPSKVPLAKLVTIEESIVLRRLGRLSEDDLYAIRKAFEKTFAIRSRR